MAPAFGQKARQPVVLNARVQVKEIAPFLAWAKEQLPGAVVNVTTSSHIFLLHGLTQQKLQLLAQCPWVLFIDVADRPAQVEAHLQNTDLRVNRVEAVHLAYPDLHGKGLTVSVKEQSFDSTDLDFRKRVLPSEAFTQTPDPHATAMATLIAGAGNTSPNGKGVAWQSRLTAAHFANLLPESTPLLKSQGVSVQNHSYGVGLENYYGLESQAYDRQTLEYPELLHVFSSGNAGTQAATDGAYAGLASFANLTGQFKVSKNTLTVGAIDTAGQVSLLSSRGPAYDGRLKPELVAFGEAGTSEAASVVSGIALLVQDAYKKQQAGKLPSAALVKAALINAADDKGRPGIDYAAGYGNADALGAVQSILENRFRSGQVSQGSSQVFKVTVPVGTVNLKVTLVWHDPEGQPTAPQALVNDLDLVLKAVNTGQQWLPWGLSTFAHKDSLLAPARRKPDRLNNVEQVTVANPVPSDYEVKVNGFSVAGMQAYSVVYEFEKGFDWGFPNEGSQVESNQKNRLRWLRPAKEGARGKLEFKWASAGAVWQTWQENVLLDKEALDITFPDTMALAYLRMKVGEAVFETGPFMVGPTLALQIGYQCDDELMLFWPKAPGADAYLVYELGPKNLQPAVQTTDTVLVLHKRQYPGKYFAVAPLVKNKTGQRSLTLDYTQQGVGCYVRNFLPRHYVTDSVVLDLQLSTSYGLAALFLEKKVNGQFTQLQTLPLGAETSYVLQDPSPASGWNEYRIKMVTQQGATFYSQPEGLIYTPKNFLLAYPNPGQAGETLYLVTPDDAAHTVLFYDQTGRLLKEYTQDGAIKAIETKGLKPGIYFLKVISPAGAPTQTKVILL